MVILNEHKGMYIVFDEDSFFAITKEMNVTLTQKHKTLLELCTELTLISKSLKELGFI